MSFRNGLKITNQLIRDDLAVELASAMREFEGIEHDREIDLMTLSRSRELRAYLRAAREQAGVLKGGASQPSFSYVPRPVKREAPPPDRREELTAALGSSRKYFASLVVFGSDRQPLFVDQLQSKLDGSIVFQTTDWLLNKIEPDERVWTAEPNEVICSVVPHPSLGKTLRCSAPVYASDKDLRAREALVADIRLDSLMSEATRKWDLPAAEMAISPGEPQRKIIVLNAFGRIVYHTNQAIRHQPVSSSMPYFVPVAEAMMSGQSGWKFFESPAGEKWLATYAPVKSFDVFLAVARNYSLAARVPKREGWILIGISILIGLAEGLFLSHYSERNTQRIERITESVAAIAGGNLGHRIELQSSDDLRPLADNVGLMTKQLREQFARESETRQFQSFVRLSAILTHDLKNAIETLSLTVTNMERHFDNKEFRADAMKSLTSATENLRALVARLSTPVTTLSGEHQRPRPVDLVPMLKRVISLTAEPARVNHEIKINLPESLFALVDVERMNKVVENLIINALETMHRKNGTLSVVAGKTVDGKPFFSVSDTGEGMSQRFIEEKLFRPFATTKTRGVGLGLYTCREVVRANGGSIEVDSREGAGTTFRVVLPSATIDGHG
ncbi:MAG: ATP-binding protein [Acidobacteriota bacterium]|nr:ATP-binding protein [Acidobacteriota bacterium]